MSAEEMTSRDQRAMTMSALGTVGGYDAVKSVLWFRLYTPLVVTIKAPDRTGKDTCRSYNSLGKSITGVVPLVSTIAHRRAIQCNGPALSPPLPLS
jgi:hypothetical protein